jgi:DNA repair protein RecN (Recombination protein N)
MPSARLIELYAHGLGVIDDARLEFGEGFNVLTGETGAGKTLMLGALQLCLGEDGARLGVHEDLRVAAVFRDLEGREVVLARELSASGRLRSSLNAGTSSSEALRALGRSLVVIHGQHDSLRLRSRAEVRALLDASAGLSTRELDEVRAHLKEARSQWAALGGNDAERERELDFIEFQLRELDAVAPTSANELVETLEELERLSELRDGQAALVSVVEGLDSGPESALGLLAGAIAALPAGAVYDEARGALRDALLRARETLGELAALADPDAVDESRLDALERRVETLSVLARKYGTLGDALVAAESLRARRGELMGATERRGELEDLIKGLEVREHDEATRLGDARRAAATALEGALARQLPRVALSGATLRFEVRGDDGSEVDLLFRPGAGQSEGPVSDVASGGELSRVLLAIALETVDDSAVAIFDEVDAGLGGQVAQQIGDCLAELGVRQQVLAVTHLATVAARASHHFVVEKVTIGERTTTSVREVTGDERVGEIARMLAGDERGGESRALAARLLETRS